MVEVVSVATGLAFAFPNKFIPLCGSSVQRTKLCVSRSKKETTLRLTIGPASLSSLRRVQQRFLFQAGARAAVFSRTTKNTQPSTRFTIHDSQAARSWNTKINNP